MTSQGRFKVLYGKTMPILEKVCNTELVRCSFIVVYGLKRLVKCTAFLRDFRKDKMLCLYKDFRVPEKDVFAVLE